MTTYDLVSAPIDNRHALSGAGVFDSAYSLGTALSDGDWLDSTLAGVGLALDTTAAVADPISALLSAGCGWIIDHVDPIKTWFDETTGNAPVVAGMAQTWSNIATHVDGQADYLESILAELYASGEWADAYRDFEASMTGQIRASAKLSSSLADSLGLASVLVQIVHDLVRDALSDIVAKAIVWVAEVALTVGFGTPVVVAQVATTVAKWAGRLGDKVVKLLRSFRSLKGLLKDAAKLLKSLRKHADDALRAARRSADDVADAARRKADDLADAARRQADDIKDSLDDAAESIETALRRLRENAQRGFHLPKNGFPSARELWDDAADRVDDIADHLRGSLSRLTKRELDKIDDWLDELPYEGLSHDVMKDLKAAARDAAKDGLKGDFLYPYRVFRGALEDGVFTPGIADTFSTLIHGKASAPEIAGAVLDVIGIVNPFVEESHIQDERHAALDLPEDARH